MVKNCYPAASGSIFKILMGLIMLEKYGEERIVISCSTLSSIHYTNKPAACSL